MRLYLEERRIEHRILFLRQTRIHTLGRMALKPPSLFWTTGHKKVKWTTCQLESCKANPITCPNEKRWRTIGDLWREHFSGDHSVVLYVGDVPGDAVFSPQGGEAEADGASGYNI